jgi:hypothetical protein
MSISKEDEKRLKALEDRTDGGHQPLVVEVVPGIDYAEAQRRSGVVYDERGRPIIKLTYTEDDANL